MPRVQVSPSCRRGTFASLGHTWALKGQAETGSPARSGLLGLPDAATAALAASAGLFGST